MRTLACLRALLATSLCALAAGGCTSSLEGPNRPPLAVAGPDRLTAPGVSVLLDGRASHDPDGDALSYHWELLAAPRGADGAALTQGAAAGLEPGQARLAPDRSGDWLVALTVDDGRLASARDLLRVRAERACATDDECDDQDACTQDRCQAGRCQSTPRDCSALDGPCVRGACEPADGQCVAAPAPDGTPCDDGLFCTAPDSCLGGACQGAARDCGPPAAPCTGWRCDEAQGACLAEAREDGAACDDGLFCVVGERCSGGQCLGDPRDCSASGGGCVDGTCDEALDACVGAPLPDHTPCDDGDACTGPDACDSGTCLGPLVDCSALDGPCAAGVCDPQTGGCLAAPLPDGEPCDDGSFCTTPDGCLAGLCQGAPRDCTQAASGFCQVGACDEDADACLALPAHEGEACDGLYCTQADACQAGQCLGGSPRACPDSLDGCSLGDCDEVTDQCRLVPAGDGLPCDDGDGCTAGDACQAGVCQGTPLQCPLGCDPVAGRCLEVDPSNADHADLCPAGALPFPADGDTIAIHTEDGTLAGTPWGHFRVISQGAGLPSLGVFSFSSIELPAGTTLQVNGANGLVLLACGDITLGGRIAAKGAGSNGGPGGYPGGGDSAAGSGYQSGGGQPGQYQTGSPYNASGGGGGGGGDAGGAGGDTPNRGGGGGGQANGPAALSPLLGGGGGGGADGYSGAHGQGGGGGGAGGGILLEGASVTVLGRLVANGGGGGAGETSYYACSGGPAQPGDDGHDADEAAPGGAPCNGEGGPGGSGGYGGELTGFGLQPGGARVTGGGGGGVGRIRINSHQGTGATLDPAAVLSPHCTGNNPRCTQGPVGLH